MNRRQTLILFCTLLLSHQPIKPEQPSSATICSEYLSMAEKCKSQGDTQTALHYYGNALRINPKLLSAAFAQGVILQSKGNLDEAIKAYHQAVEISPTCSQAFYNCAVCYSEQKAIELAFVFLKHALEINPNYEKALIQIGLLCQDKNEHNKAIEYFCKALEISPNSSSTQHRLAKSYAALSKMEQAATHLEHALALDPNNHSLQFELANAYNYINRYEEALTIYETLWKKFPDSAEIGYNYAYMLKRMGRAHESIPVYQAVLQKKPDNTAAQFGLGLAYLTTGDFKHGWPQYEWRWNAYGEKPKQFAKPMWSGFDIQGKTIYVYAEQGLGDTFQFVRYMKLLKERGATIIFETQKPLIDVLALYPYIDQLVTRQPDQSTFDTHIPVMSLPLIFGTDLDTIPHEIPYLYANENLVSYWKEQLKDDHNFKIGICWQGNASYSTQALRMTVAAKSATAQTFAPLAQIPGVSFYSLQKMNGEDQINSLPEGFVVRSFEPHFDNEHGRFMDTAALIKNLDLVITVDTSISHFSAALGADVWVLLPNPADWRWMENCTTTPWYPNMRLFRQETPGDWANLIDTVCTSLKEHLAQRQG